MIGTERESTIAIRSLQPSYTPIDKASLAGAASIYSNVEQLDTAAPRDCFIEIIILRAKTSAIAGIEHVAFQKIGLLIAERQQSMCEGETLQLDRHTSISKSPNLSLLNPFCLFVDAAIGFHERQMSECSTAALPFGIPSQGRQ